MSDDQIAAAENEGMIPIPPNGPYKDPTDVKTYINDQIEASLEQIDPGSNHREMMEMLGGIFVQLSRIYDVLLIGSTQRVAIDEEHTQGKLFSSPPTLLEDAWSEDEASKEPKK